MLADAYDTRVLQQLDDLQLQLAEEQERLQQLLARSPRSPRGCRAPVSTPGTAPTRSTRTSAARPTTSRIATATSRRASSGAARCSTSASGAASSSSCSRELDVDARGIEVDPHSSSGPRTRGLDVEVGDAVEYLDDLDDASLGGLVMIQVIEHLSPQHVIDVVRLAAEKVRPGGRVVVETVNPTSLYTYAHAFWVDPDHVRPVHPNYLGFLFAEAGFAEVERLRPFAGSGRRESRADARRRRGLQAAERELRTHQRVAVRPAGLRHRRDSVSRDGDAGTGRGRHPPGARGGVARRRDHEPRVRHAPRSCAASAVGDLRAPHRARARGRRVADQQLRSRRHARERLDLPRVDRSVRRARLPDDRLRAARARVPQRHAGPILRTVRPGVRRAARSRSRARSSGCARASCARSPTPQYNARELEAMGYRDVRVVPPVVEHASPVEGRAARVDDAAPRDVSTDRSCCRSAS